MATAVAKETSVVMEHSPVVAGQASSGGRGGDGSGSDSTDSDTDSFVATSSAVAEPLDADRFPYFRAASHLEDAGSDVIEAGDIPFEVGMKDLAITFNELDWRQKHSTLIAGDWTSKISHLYTSHAPDQS